MKDNLEQAPLEFIPYLKSVIWGGDKICHYKHISQDEPNIGESWEISVVPGHESIVTGGKYNGWKLTDLIDKFGADIIGEDVYKRYNGSFPLLVKLIDANDNLSVQVHPDDSLAMKRHKSLGKTEMWYIIKSDKGAKIYSGLNRSITPKEYEDHVAKDTFASVLAEHESNPGDVFFLPAGRVHAIGAGNLLAEIQESSDITYRIYDYGRRDKDGNPRELHTELAKSAIDFSYHENYKSPRPSEHEKEALLASCEHFKTKRILLDGLISLPLDKSSFTILICIEGSVKVTYSGGEKTLNAGHSLLIPACMKEVKLQGKATILTSRS